MVTKQQRTKTVVFFLCLSIVISILVPYSKVNGEEQTSKALIMTTRNISTEINAYGAANIENGAIYAMKNHGTNYGASIAPSDVAITNDNLFQTNY